MVGNIIYLQILPACAKLYIIHETLGEWTKRTLPKVIFVNHFCQSYNYEVCIKYFAIFL